MKKRMDKVKEKGHQKLTILVVPHGHDLSQNFHISLFSLLFLFALVFGLIATSILSIVKSNKTNRQLSELSAIYGIFLEYYLTASDEMKEIQEDFGNIQENLLESYSLLEGSDEELWKIPSENQIFSQASLELEKEELTDPLLSYSRKYFSEIYEIRALKYRMAENQRLLDSAEDILEKQDAFYEFVPLRKPISIFNLTSNFGLRRSPTTGDFELHEGLDLANAPGTPIVATASGVVDKIIYARVGYGHHVILAHKFGYYTLYGHCSRILVRPGQEVQKGEVIAEVGSTGNVTGPHLHYEIWLNETQKTDPEEFFQSGI